MHNKPVTFANANMLVMDGTYQLESVWLKKVLRPIIEILLFN